MTIREQYELPISPIAEYLLLASASLDYTTSTMDKYNYSPCNNVLIIYIDNYRATIYDCLWLERVDTTSVYGKWQTEQNI